MNYIQHFYVKEKGASDYHTVLDSDGWYILTRID